jgi:hypothetical protein
MQTQGGSANEKKSAMRGGVIGFAAFQCERIHAGDSKAPRKRPQLKVADKR